MKDKLSKLDRVKIRFRDKLQRFIRDEINNLEIGDLDQEEFEVFRQEATDFIEIIRDKDKYIEAMEEYKNGRNKNISRYFDR